MFSSYAAERVLHPVLLIGDRILFLVLKGHVASAQVHSAPDMIGHLAYAFHLTTYWPIEPS